VVRDTLVNAARPFLFSTAPLPVLAVALEAALDVLEAEPERRLDVHAKAGRLRRDLVAAGADVGESDSAIVPVIVGANQAALDLQAGLQAAGFDARAVRPPTVPPGTARLRVTARHPVADAQLQRFAQEVARLLSSRAA
jgi:8-amino-7-oxononanoate synthase